VPSSECRFKASAIAASGFRPQIHTVLIVRVFIIRSVTSHKSESANIELSTREVDGVKVLAVDGPLTINTPFKFQDAWRAEKAPALILDLSAVPYADSAAIGSIVNAYVSRKNANRTMAVIAGARVRTTMEITKVDKLFPLCSTVEEALASVR
jgi:anti-anti-sigma factor